MGQPCAFRITFFAAGDNAFFCFAHLFLHVNHLPYTFNGFYKIKTPTIANFSLCSGLHPDLLNPSARFERYMKMALPFTIGRSSGSRINLLIMPSRHINMAVAFMTFVPGYSGGTASDFTDFP